MSHWTKVKTKISNLAVLKDAITSCGCVFTEQAEYKSLYAGTLSCVGVISAAGEKITNRHGAAVVKTNDGYEIVMDNYSNSLVSVAGTNCERITQKYAEKMTETAMINAGYMLDSAQIDEESGDRIITFVTA